MVKAEKGVYNKAGDMPWEEAEEELSLSSAMFGVHT
jgi:hypothetical protein